MLQSVVLPDGKYWGFIYDSSDGSSTAYGDLLQIILPTGGTIGYTWNTIGPCNTTWGVWHRSVASRTMTANGVSETWTYAAGGGAGAQVTDPDGNEIQYTFTDESAGGLACIYYETERQYLQNESGTLTSIKTVNTQYTAVQSYDYRGWAAAFPTNATTTWSATGQAWKETTSYDSGFSATAYLCAGPSGAWYCQDKTMQPIFGKAVSQSVDDYSGGLLRNTATSYEWQSNSAYLAANLLNTPSQVTVTGSSGESQTNYTYDESERVGLSSGVSTMLGAPPTSGVYGHVTTTTQWLNIGGTSPNSYTYWQNDGEIDHTVDPKGNTTSYKYSDAYDGAYRTRTTNALGQSVSAAYDFNTGLETSFTDANNQTTNYGYDAMNRLTSVSDPDDGHTSYTYDPSGYPDNSVLTQTLMCGGEANCPAGEPSGQTEKTLDVYDGFGRPSETELLSDPSGPDETLTSYDPLGNVESLTNPYRSTSDATYGSTTYQHDMLGRETGLQHLPDRSTEIWAYSGNQVTFTDENLNQWQRTTDALGRLTKVLEPNGTGTTPSMETDYSYDALGNLLTVAQWGGGSGERLRTFTYDSLSRLLCASNPENSTAACPATATASYTSGTTGYTYDADSNVHTRTDARGITTTYSYDNLNDLTGKTYSDLTTPTACFLYGTTTSGNEVGRLMAEWTQTAGSSCPTTASTPPSGALTEREIGSYDPMGRILTDEQCLSIGNCSPGALYTLTYGYDLIGDVTSSTDGLPGSSALAFSTPYNAAARLASASGSPSGGSSESTTLFTATRYWPAGELNTASVGIGTTQPITLTRSYNPRLLPTSEADTVADTPGSVNVAITGAEQTSFYSTGSVSISGSWQVGNEISIEIGGTDLYQAQFGQSSTPDTVAASLASLMTCNAGYTYPIQAVAIGDTVFFTSCTSGPNTNYSISASPSPTVTTSGATMTPVMTPTQSAGGLDVSFSETGQGTLGEGEFEALLFTAADSSPQYQIGVSWGPTSTSASLAASLAASIGSCSTSGNTIGATASGSQVYIAGCQPGAYYSVSVDLDYSSGGTASFSATVEGAAYAVDFTEDPSGEPGQSIVEISATGSGGTSSQDAFVNWGSTSTPASVAQGLVTALGSCTTSGTLMSGTAVGGMVYLLGCQPGDTYTVTAGMTGCSCSSSNPNPLFEAAVVGTSSLGDIPGVVDAAGAVTLSVNGTQIASTTYGASSTPASIASALAAAASSSSPVSVSPNPANSSELLLTEKDGETLGSDSYALDFTYNSTDFPGPPFAANPSSGSIVPGGTAPVYNWAITSYAPNGNVVDMTDSVMGTWSFSYDTLNRLATSAGTQPGNSLANECWSYDAFGNRTMQMTASVPFATTAGGASTCEVAPGGSVGSTFWAQYNGTVNGSNNNQMSETSWNTDQAAYYDRDGDVTNDGRNTYAYDADNRIVGMDGWTYVYDAEGRRVAKESGGTLADAYMLGLGGEQVTEVNASGWAHSNVYAGGSLLATYEGPAGTEPAGYYFHFTDWLGTERVQTYADGSPDIQCVSYPFGDGPICYHATEQQFTGKERDTESGNDYFGARYYASTMGRFLTPDWASDPTAVPYASYLNPQSLNLYNYMRNNPLSGVDKDGHCPWCVWALAGGGTLEAGEDGAGIGAAVGGPAGAVVGGLIGLGVGAIIVHEMNNSTPAPATTTATPAATPTPDFVVTPGGTAVSTDPNRVAGSLTGAPGVTSTPTTQSGEQGTLHTGVQTPNGPVDVRTMSGSKTNAPRTVITHPGTNNPKTPDGKATNDKGQSHIPSDSKIPQPPKTPQNP